MSLLFEGGLAVVALGLGWLLSTPPLATVTSSSTPIWLAALWGLVGTLPMLALLAVLEVVNWRPVAELREVVACNVTPMFMPLSVAELAVISLSAGIGEEMLFRGVLQAAPMQWLQAPWGIIAGMALASVLFGLCHFVTRTYAVLAGLMGVYFGVLFLLTGNLLSPVIAHALYDFLALCYLTRSRWSRWSPPAP